MRVIYKRGGVNDKGVSTTRRGGRQKGTLPPPGRMAWAMSANLGEGATLGGGKFAILGPGPTATICLYKGQGRHSQLGKFFNANFSRQSFSLLGIQNSFG